MHIFIMQKAYHSAVDGAFVSITFHLSACRTAPELDSIRLNRVYGHVERIPRPDDLPAVQRAAWRMSNTLSGSLYISCFPTCWVPSTKQTLRPCCHS
jgi:hypothetical protein